MVSGCHTEQNVSQPSLRIQIRTYIAALYWFPLNYSDRISNINIIIAITAAILQPPSFLLPLLLQSSSNPAPALV